MKERRTAGPQDVASGAALTAGANRLGTAGRETAEAAFKAPREAVGTPTSPRFFAIVPAAGQSVRMGRPKLLLPWGTATVIEAVLQAWADAGVINQVVVVLHRDNRPLHDLCRRAGVMMVIPDHPPPDMKSSVLAGLEHVGRLFVPTGRDSWLLAPADFPQLSAAVIQQLVARRQSLLGASDGDQRILVPRHAGRRGHPVLFPWNTVPRVRSLTTSQGINALLTEAHTLFLDIDTPQIAGEMNTPHDYDQLRREFDGPPRDGP